MTVTEDVSCVWSLGVVGVVVVSSSASVVATATNI